LIERSELNATAAMLSSLMHLAAQFLKAHIGKGKAFETQTKLAELSGQLPSTLTGSLRAAQLEPATISKLCRALPEDLKTGFLLEVVKDAIPQELWHRVLQSPNDELIQYANAPLGPKVEALMNLVRLKAIQEKPMKQLLGALADVCGLTG
jgi:hypothetical protein